VETLEFSISLILVSLLCDLKNHAIVGSTLSVRRFFIINLIEQGYMLVVVVGVSYGTTKHHFRFGVAFNAIYGMHQSSMIMKI
jgi:hypothetical protein